jgi:hypothetical protein
MRPKGIRSCDQCKILSKLDPMKVPGDCSQCAPSTDLAVSDFLWPELLDMYPGMIISSPFGGMFVSYENCRIVASLEDVPLDELIQAIEALKAGYGATSTKEKKRGK